MIFWSKWTGTWTLEPHGQNSWLVAIAKGPGIEELFWPIGRPWQPDTPEWTPYVFGATGAVWLDEDGDGEKRSAYEYASEIVNRTGGNLFELFRKLADFDESVAIQTAGILFSQFIDLLVPVEIDSLIKESTPHVRSGFEKVTAFLTENPN
ncbi:hypothetical protein BH23BAC3_BH23BAC3_35490 [soil metagenome]